jgi:protein-S-isoprenylcysteine O-methyltransferase Ste14
MVNIAFSLLSYAVFILTSIYATGFAGGFGVPRSIDGPQMFPFAEAVIVDAGLLLLFGLQHSVMARPGFKRAWTRWIPDAIERSAYVLFSSLALIALFAFWRPIEGVVWEVTSPASYLVWGGYAAGWLVLLLSSFMISHAELFGLSQAWHALRGRPVPIQPLSVKWLYKVVRHPIMLGFLIAFWSVPRMTVGHLVFSLGMTVYVLIGLHFEERDLERGLGDDYRVYQSRVPMLLPWPKKRRRDG